MTPAPPIVVEITFVSSVLKKPAVPKPPTGRPRQVAPSACTQSSISGTLVLGGELEQRLHVRRDPERVLHEQRARARADERGEPSGSTLKSASRQSA